MSKKKEKPWKTCSAEERKKVLFFCIHPSSYQPIILKAGPHTSHLTPQISNLKPQTSVFQLTKSYIFGLE